MHIMTCNVCYVVDMVTSPFYFIFGGEFVDTVLRQMLRTGLFHKQDSYLLPCDICGSEQVIFFHLLIVHTRSIEIHVRVYHTYTFCHNVSGLFHTYSVKLEQMIYNDAKYQVLKCIHLRQVFRKFITGKLFFLGLGSQTAHRS